MEENNNNDYVGDIEELCLICHESGEDKALVLLFQNRRV